MSIENLAAKQRGSFISIGEVLTQLSETSGMTQMGVATALYRLFFIDTKFDRWVIYSPLYGPALATEEFRSFAEKYLETVARNGRYLADERCPEDGEKFGFYDEEIRGVLAEYEEADFTYAAQSTAHPAQQADWASESVKIQGLLATTIKERDSALERVAQLELELERCRPADQWWTHRTKVFSKLPEVLAAAKSKSSWPKQEPFILELVAMFDLSKTEAEALDKVTRPDELRKV